MVICVGVGLDVMRRESLFPCFWPVSYVECRRILRLAPRRLRVTGGVWVPRARLRWCLHQG